MQMTRKTNTLTHNSATIDRFSETYTCTYPRFLSGSTLYFQGRSGARGGVRGAREDRDADRGESDDCLHRLGDPGGLRRLFVQEAHRAWGEWKRKKRGVGCSVWGERDVKYQTEEEIEKGCSKGAWRLGRGGKILYIGI